MYKINLKKKEVRSRRTSLINKTTTKDEWNKEKDEFPMNEKNIVVYKIYIHNVANVIKYTLH